MHILVNGNQHAIMTGTNLSQLLKEFKIESGHVVIELNRNIVPQQQFGTTTLKADDEVELIQFVGGG